MNGNAMVVQICFNQDNTLSNMKVNEEHKPAGNKNQKDCETNIVYSIVV